MSRTVSHCDYAGRKVKINVYISVISKPNIHSRAYSGNKYSPLPRYRYKQYLLPVQPLIRAPSTQYCWVTHTQQRGFKPCRRISHNTGAGNQRLHPLIREVCVLPLSHALRLWRASLGHINALFLQCVPPMNEWHFRTQCCTVRLYCTCDFRG